jgi:hypothetical protein
MHGAGTRRVRDDLDRYQLASQLAKPDAPLLALPAHSLPIRMQPPPNYFSRTCCKLLPATCWLSAGCTFPPPGA